jgi:spermidine/putrescine transport system ATP-binding protein
MLVVISEAVKRFAAPEGGVITALDSVSLDVGGSEFVTLLGPSGCGKTTLLRAISGFEDLDSGRITIDGQAMEHVPPHKRPVNTVFQNYALFPHLTVGDNIGYGLDVTGCPKAERNKRLTDALELVGLAGFEKRRPRQLSGGQQQRVALARAIVNRPKLLLLDEPLSALDRKLRQTMQLELKNIQNELGISFVFVTHDQEEALTMSDRIIVMDHGRVQQMGTPTEIYDTPASVFVAQFIGESNLFEGTIRRDGDAMTIITDDGLSLVVRDRNAKLSQGTRATVLIRPEDLHLAEPDQPLDGGQATFDASLLQTVFVGADFQIVARTSNGQEIKATIRDPSRQLASRLRHGAAIRFRYGHDAARLLPTAGEP